MGEDIFGFLLIWWVLRVHEIGSIIYLINQFLLGPLDYSYVLESQNKREQINMKNTDFNVKNTFYIKNTSLHRELQDQR